MVFPIITVPYVSRTLGVDNIGIYSYTNSVAYMFMLFGMLGISNYGNRSVARVRDDRETLSKTFSSIYLLQLSINLIATSSYFIYLWLFGSHYGVIDWLQLVYVISICFDVSWFYFGLEKFKLTIIRNLAIKVASLALIILVVKAESDLWKYTLIMAGSTLVSQLCLFSLLPRFVEFSLPTFKDVLSHLREVAVLFIPVLSFSVYRVMDKAMLGGMFSVTELGYFEAAEKVINIPLAIITALGTVMLPRMSYILSDPEADYKKTIRESMQLALILSTTMAGWLIVASKDVSDVLFGPEFDESAEIISLLAVTVVASACSNVVRTQYLIPRGLNSIYVTSTVGAAALNLAINIVLIPRFGAFGACVGTIAAEFFVVVYQFVSMRKDLEVACYLKTLGKCTVHAFVMMMPAYFVAGLFEGHIARLIASSVMFLFIFCFFNLRYLLVEFFGIRSCARK